MYMYVFTGEMAHWLLKADCFSKGPGFGSQHPHRSSQPHGPPAPGDLAALFWTLWAPHTHGAQTHLQAKHGKYFFLWWQTTCPATVCCEEMYFRIHLSSWCTFKVFFFFYLFWHQLWNQDASKNQWDVRAFPLVPKIMVCILTSRILDFVRVWQFFRNG